ADGVMVTAGQFGRAPVTPGEVVCLENLHDLRIGLHDRPLWRGARTDSWGDLLSVRGEVHGPSVGRSLSATGEPAVSADRGMRERAASPAQPHHHGRASMRGRF